MLLAYDLHLQILLPTQTESANSEMGKIWFVGVGWWVSNLFVDN